MRILIFAEYFDPPGYQPRVRYFASYLAKKGWDVCFITEGTTHKFPIPENVDGHFVDYYKFKHGFLSKIEWTYKFIVNLFFDHKGNCFYHEAKKIIKGEKVDVVFGSSCFTFPLTTVAKIAREKQIPYFLDLRDIIEQSSNDDSFLKHKPPLLFGNLLLSIYKKVFVHRRNWALTNATSVTTVSSWHVDTLTKYNKNTFLIYNGFDESIFIPHPTPNDRFAISYFGRIYNERIRDPHLLFEALSQLKASREITKQNTVVKWFVDGHSKEIVQKMASEYGLCDWMSYSDFVPTNVVVEEMNKSSIVLVLSNKTTEKNYFGIMTTKLFEAIGMNRPILCIPNNHDHLALLVDEIQGGLASSDITEIKDFLRNHFLAWQESRITKGIIDSDTRKKFSRAQSAEKLETLFLNALK
jgi:glycosyltransferase involved in cell wall biosynthesis